MPRFCDIQKRPFLDNWTLQLNFQFLGNEKTKIFTES